MSLDLAEIIRRWPAATIRWFNEVVTQCEDCELPNPEFGHKCRPCYLQWKRLVWEDIPKCLAEITLVSRQLNLIGEGDRKAIADVALGTATRGVSGRNADLYAIVKRVLDGPFGPQLKAKLQAIQNASNEAKKGSRKSGSSEVD